MQYLKTTEGYPVLLATRTRSRFFSERDLTHGNRKSAWVYLTQNPSGRWQVLTSGSEPGEILCVAGAPTAAQVLPAFVQTAVDLGILKRGTGMRGNPTSTRRVLENLGWFVRIYGQNRSTDHGYLKH